MKFPMFALLALFLSLTAKASVETYDCTAFLPRGKASMVVQTEDDGGQSVRLAFTNGLRNQTHIGTLQILENSSRGFLAVGDLLAYEINPVIGVSLHGSLIPGPDGAVNVVLYAAADRRIEYGYGNPLHCRKR